MNRKILAGAICAALFVTDGAWAQDNSGQSQDQAVSTPQQTKEEKKTLQAVVVTGSLIPQAEIETASPVITITGQDLQTQGFRNVYDALRTTSIANGSVQDSQSASQGNFTPGATTISLFGLDPGFTLVLINGHPLANYPLPYNGVGDIADLSNIPTSMVDHIDVLSGGQSSLYGSSAVAGVVNIVLKKKIDGTNVDFRVGGHTGGGGQSERLELTGGHDWNNFSITYGLSVENQDPIRVQDSFWPSRFSSPLGPPYVAGRDFLVFEPFTGQYFDPPAGACSQSAYLFGGTSGLRNRPGSGNFCGSYYDSGLTSLLNKSLNANGYLNLSYKLSDNAELYGDVLYGFSKQVINTGPSYWAYQNPQLSQSANSFSGVFWDNTVGDFVTVQRYFAPEEMGAADAGADRVRTRQYNADFGVRGNFGDSDWAYDLYYNRSQVNTDDDQRWPLTKPFNDYYLGQQQGTDPYGYGFPAYTPDLANFYKPLTPAQFYAMTGVIQSSSLSWQQNVHLTLTNTDLFQMRGGAAGLAFIAEMGNEAFHSPVDPGLIAGDFNNRTGTEGAGTRKRWAVGAELRLPLLESLTADLSARYDSYSFSGRTDAKPTYKVGLEYRPVDTLLLRGSYATSFRAPDMYYIYQQPSGFYTTATDYYFCRLQGYDASNLSQCPQSAESVFSFYRGSPDLKDITAKSYGVGIVWSPSSKFNLKADYTRINIDNEVTTQSPDSLLQTEADCRFGVSLGGQPYDINSALCQDALSKVNRYPLDYPFLLAQGQLQNVQTFPINIASEWVDGIQASTDYRIDFGKYGNLDLGAQYFVELNHKSQQNPGDPELDLLHNYNSYEFKTRSSASASWAIGDWTTTVFGTLYGKSVNYYGTGTFGRWATFNGSVNYAVAKDAAIQLTVNNLFNRAPPTDNTFSQPSNAIPPPYYNVYSYNGFGRMYWLEYKLHFK